MDITSYLLGKNASGGETPSLQDKAVTITENTTTTITADSGYDGLNTVEITTNVSGGGDVPTLGVTFSNWDSSGYPHNANLIGFNAVYAYYFYSKNNTSMLSKLEDISFPSSFSGYFGNYAFAGCENLNITQMPSNMANYVGSYSFENCKKLALTSLPEGITSLGESAFSNCIALKLEKIPNSVSTIGKNCFFGCTSLTKMNMNNFASVIPTTCFYGCNSLASVYAPNIIGVYGTTTSNSAFRGCTGLKAVWLGSSVTSANMGLNSFAGCINLIKIYIDLPRATVETFANYQYAFMNNTAKVGIIVCNDDSDWLTAEQFNEIDWGTYTP